MTWIIEVGVIRVHLVKTLKKNTRSANPNCSNFQKWNSKIKKDEECKTAFGEHHILYLQKRFDFTISNAQ